MGENCLRLLSEGLDLCVRARKLDAIDRRQAHLDFSMVPEEWVASGLFEKFIEINNLSNPHAPIEPRCLTPQLWAQDQYEHDLFDWENRARKYLSNPTDEEKGE